MTKLKSTIIASFKKGNQFIYDKLAIFQIIGNANYFELVFNIKITIF